jgi:hypothetical protein
LKSLARLLRVQYVAQRNREERMKSVIGIKDVKEAAKKAPTTPAATKP